MPSGRKDIYGAPSRRLADPKVIMAEMGAAKNAAAAAKYVKPKPDMREGTTNPSGGRAPVKMPAKTPAPKPVQVIRTTVNMKPTPAAKKR